MEQGQKELFALLNRRADIQAKQQRSDTMVEQINIRKAELGKRLLDRKTQETDLDSVLADCKKDLEEVSAASFFGFFLALTLVSGRNVARPKRFCFRNAIIFFAVASSSVTIF